MPVPNPARRQEYARKGVELLLRTLAIAPEQRTARRLAHAEARALPLPARDAPRVLFLTPRDWAAHVQYEAVLGHALRARGADVRFLTCGGGLEICDRANTYEAPPMPCSSCAQYTETSLRAHGFPVRRLADLWATEPAQWPELDEFGADELSDVHSGGVPLGQLIDTSLKWFLCAAAIEDDPLAAPTARAFLRSGRRIARAVERALDEIRPDTVVMLSGLFLFEAITWAICRERGIDVVTYERAFRKETLVFSRDTPAGFYEVGAEWSAHDRALGATEATELDEYLADRRRGDAFDQYWRFEEHAVEHTAPGRLAVAFTNLTWDTAVVDRDLALGDIRSWIDCLVEEFSARPQDRLVIRVHPSEVRLPMKATRDSLLTYIERRWPDLPANIEVIPPGDLTSSYPLMDAADLGLVYTSTTGLELALAGTPVIVAGAVHYRGKGFTNDPGDEAQLRSMIRQGLDDPATLIADPETARRYAHFFWFRAPVPAVGVREPVPGLARLTLHGIEELAPGTNPDLDHVCEAILDPSRSFLRTGAPR